MKYYNEEDYYKSEGFFQTNSLETEFGCGFCWDKKRNKSKELFFLDAANNMRICTYCPNCGRKYSEV